MDRLPNWLHWVGTINFFSVYFALTVFGHSCHLGFSPTCWLFRVQRGEGKNDPMNIRFGPFTLMLHNTN